MIKGLLITGGILNLLLAVFHMLFWKVFNWPEGLICLSVDNRAIMQTFNLVVILILLFFAAKSLFCIEQLRRGLLGVLALLTIASLWLMRGLSEILFWGMEKGAISWVILIVCLIVTVIYVIPALPSFRKD